MGVLLAVFAVLFIILQLFSGRLSDRVGRWVPTISGLALSVVALVILPLVEDLPVMVMVMALYGIAYGLIFPSVSAMVADHTAPEERGMATGVFHALLTAGVAIGAPVMGWTGSLVGIETGLRLSAVMMVVALVVAVSVRKRL